MENISPDTIVFFRLGPLAVNATIVYTWAVMALLTLISWLATRKLTTGTKISKWQNALEAVAAYIRSEVRDITEDKPERYLPLLGTLFLFVSLSNFLAFIPGYEPPTGSLSTTAALALCVFVAVPAYGISRIGVRSYLNQYIQPVFFMLPFNILSELSRTLALAVRLFGNVMSTTLMSAVLLSLVPFFVPVIMEIFGLLIGQIHAYIFAVLSAVYIASGARG
jgi:F-type H+-transporting ATPase subunit a